MAGPTQRYGCPQLLQELQAGRGPTGSSRNGQRLTMEQRAWYLIAAGCPVGDTLRDFLAISERESGGYVCAINRQGRDDSYGLWQINRHPQATGNRFPLAQLLSADGNARAAWELSRQGRDLTPWRGTAGAEVYLPAATLAVSNFRDNPGYDPFANSGAGNVPDPGATEMRDPASYLGDGIKSVVDAAILNPLGAVGAFVGTLLRAETWVRVAEVLGGTALILFALFRLANKLGLTGGVASVAAKAAMAGV